MTIARPPRNEPSYIVEKTPQGWRIVISEDELRGAPADKVTELFKQQRDAYEKLREQIAAGQLKTWQEFSDASGQIRKTFRAGLKAAAPAGGAAK